VADAASDRDSARDDASAAAPRDAAADASTDVDAGAAAVDASTASAADSGAELARALDRTGVNAEPRRMELLLAAMCRREVRCAAYEEVDACVEEMNLASAAFILAASPPCADALLDQWACHAQTTCEEETTCVEGLEPAMRLCSDLIAPEGQEP
jgi:hypothetical protein